MQPRSQFREQLLASPQYALWIERDLQWARRLNVSVQSRILLGVLVVASWLGDGVFWYALIGALAFLGGTEGRDVAVQMALAGLVNLTLYSFLKRWTGRPRPFVKCPDIRACARALDRFSFPSGHVQHAMAFTIILLVHFPAAAFWLIPVGVLIALSRVTLGLHYPSDVAAGAVIGTSVAALVLSLY
jgi:undecaprenyl-diphosphatase